MGRNTGSRNKVYFFVFVRRYFVDAGSRKVPLRDEAGSHLKARKTPEAAPKGTYARYLFAAPAAIATLPDSITVAQVCETYLDQCKAMDKLLRHPRTFRQW
jgi:hypothetical protein